MSRTPHHAAAFGVGLAALAWVGVASFPSNPLALAMTGLIAAFYVMGAHELRRFRQATASLVDALAHAPAAGTPLAPWLERIHPSLQHPVRLRIEGDRVALPGPAMTPYLVGLLVLLGMLGTFLGMVATLHGTGLALESATDLQAIRASLATPVKGLGLAFGTSVAGVAASAMLGLVSAWCRRERAQASQRLDAAIASTLRPHSRAHQREESLRLMQRQAEAVPLLVDRLQSLMDTLQRQGESLHERLVAGQDTSLRRTENAYAALAASLDRSLKDSLAESGRHAGAAIQPVVEATMAGIARETADLREALAGSVQRQLDGMAERVEAGHARLAELWGQALAQHAHTSEAVTRDLHATLERCAGTFAERSAALVERVEQRSAGLSEAVARTHAAWRDDMAGTVATLARETASLHAGIAGAVGTQLEGVADRLDRAVDGVTRGFEATLAQQAQAGEAQAARTERALVAAAGAFEAHAASLLQGVAQAQAAQQASLADAQAAQQAALAEAHAAQQAALAAQHDERLAAWTGAVTTMASALTREWQDAGAQALERQQRLCETFERTAGDITAQSQAHAKATLAEVARLMQAAAEAPRAAAEVIGGLRAQLSEGMARDQAMLAERERLLGTLATLLDDVTHASTAQREAVDALVASASSALEGVGQRFATTVEAQAGTLAAVAAQVTGSAVEVASLGEAFGHAVALFSASSDKLAAHLQRLDTALGASIARSDEQLAYYVAQAREIIDLSLMSQKQVVEDLQRLGARRVAADAEA